MHFSHDELVLIYNGEDPRDKRTLAYATSMAPKVNKQELSSVRVSSTLFEKALDQLGMTAKEVINKANEDYQRELRGKEMSNEEWFNHILKNPKLLKAPIALYKGRGGLCNSEADILKLKSAG
ncbi:arsenate reductase family protein [Luteibaculum oceani]|uniref:Arsenate reductase n=1 Tax=Luteibaculum oceani TaxID=1294296 RepID=A0A5C6VEC1_9FLAO|nr:ArsC/Spx/MgsR family protein [Luteibaculum oceani]TXC82155.1 hypothetical protein FRX97_03410 [Luteibaculum oceani]